MVKIYICCWSWYLFTVTNWHYSKLPHTPACHWIFH